MADQTNEGAAPAASTPTYDPAKTYDVQLARAVEWPPRSGFYFSPRDHQTMNGALVEEIKDDVLSAEQV